MTIAYALLLLVAIKYYLIKLPVFNKVPEFSHETGVRAYFSGIAKLLSYLPVLPTVVTIVLVICPMLVVVVLADGLFLLLAGKVGAIIFSTIVLYYCLSTTENIDNLKHTEILIAAHEQMFGIIFWFTLLGPAGAAFYLLLINRQLIDRSYVFFDPKFNTYLDTLHGLAAWVPARITGLIYALVGNFISGFECWLKCMQIMTLQSSQLLSDCGQAALGTGTANFGAANSNAEQDEQRTKDLVRRAFIGWIVFGVLIALIIK